MGKVSLWVQWLMVAAGVLLSPVVALFMAWFPGWPRIRRLWPRQQSRVGIGIGELKQVRKGEAINRAVVHSVVRYL